MANANDCSTLINKLLKATASAPNTEVGVAAEPEKVKLRLAVTEGGSSTGVKYIAGDAYLTSVAMTCAVGEVLSADVAFQVDGARSEVGDMSVYMGEDGSLLIERTAVGQGLLLEQPGFRRRQRQSKAFQL